MSLLQERGACIGSCSGEALKPRYNILQSSILIYDFLLKRTSLLDLWLGGKDKLESSSWPKMKFQNEPIFNCLTAHRLETCWPGCLLSQNSLHCSRCYKSSRSALSCSFVENKKFSIEQMLSFLFANHWIFFTLNFKRSVPFRVEAQRMSHFGICERLPY